ncbi:MAG: hypothetical protein ACJAZO_000007 [Myxococcota bacterium]|jgi:hypothetical protein
MKTSLTVLACSVLTMASASASRLDASSAEASTTYPPEGNETYGANHVMDGKVATSWVEGADGSGLGSWVRMTLPAETSVQKVKVWGGMWNSHEYWTRANRPKDIEFRFSDGSIQAFTMADEMVAQEFALPAAVSTTTVEVRVKSVHNGTTWLDTGISEVQVFDATAGIEKPASAIIASSVLPADGDGNYETANVQDGITDTMWCEGTDGDGTGETLEFTLAGNPTISKVHMINGIGSSLRLWMAANRANAATLTFSDGSTETIQVKPTIMMQTAEFTPRATSSVTLSLTGVTAGREYNDMCMSEVRFE